LVIAADANDGGIRHTGGKHLAAVVWLVGAPMERSFAHEALCASLLVKRGVAGMSCPR